MNSLPAYRGPTDYDVTYRSRCVYVIKILFWLGFCQLGNSHGCMILPSFLTNPAYRIITQILVLSLPFIVISTALSFFWFGSEVFYVHSLLSQETKTALFLNFKYTATCSKRAKPLISTTWARRHFFITYNTKKLKREACSSLGKVFFCLLKGDFKTELKGNI